MPDQVSPPVDDFNARAARGQWATVCDQRLSFDDPRLAQLRDIWQAVRGDREMPRRGDFSARILGKHLQRLTFVECVRGGGAHRYRFRLFGSALAQYIGDSTGKFLEEVVPANFLESWVAAYDLVMDMRRPLRFVSRFQAAELEHVQAECFMSPLAGEASEPWGLLVSVVYSPVVP